MDLVEEKSLKDGLKGMSEEKIYEILKNFVG